MHMLKSIVMHQLDYNEIAACEEWYYRCHGPQIARRYGPWLARFESFRPVPLPKDMDEEKIGYTNWLTTVGYWREMPDEMDGGNQALSSPKAPARNFSAFMPPLAEDDWKGAEYAPEEKPCLRLLQLWSYPDGVNKKAADQEYCEKIVPQICEMEEVYRFFGSRTMEDEIHLPGHWKAEEMERMMKNGSKFDHQWDRMAELWFETFDDMRAYIKNAESFEKPSWMQQESYPFLRPYENYVCTVLMERPAFDWMKDTNVYR